MCISTQCNAYEVWNNIHKYFYIWQPYFLFHIYDHLSLPTQQTYLFLKYLKVSSHSHIFYIWQPRLFFHIYDYLNIPYLTGMFVFSFIPITFETVESCIYTPVSTCNSNVHEVLSDSWKCLHVAAIFVLHTHVYIYTHITDIHMHVLVYVVYVCNPILKGTLVSINFLIYGIQF